MDLARNYGITLGHIAVPRVKRDLVDSSVNEAGSRVHASELSVRESSRFVVEAAGLTDGINYCTQRRLPSPRADCLRPLQTALQQVRLFPNRLVARLLNLAWHLGRSA